MKRFQFFKTQLLFLISFFCILNTKQLQGEIYYLSPSGSNDNPGTIERPWRTLQTAAGKMSPGDTLLMRGGMYRQATQLSVSHSGSSGYPLLFRNYPGEVPVFCKSKSFSNSSDWTDRGGNIWETKKNAVTGYDVGCVWHDDLASEKKWQPSDLRQQWDFYYNPSNKSVELYSTSHPVELAESIEIPDGAQWQHVIQIFGCGYLIFDGLHVKYSNTHGIQIAGESHHITIRNCTVSHCGGARISDQTRYGNGIEVWESAHNILIENNSISWIFDSGLTNQGEQGTQSDLVFRGNTVSNTKCGYEYWGDEEMAVRNILVEDNNFTDSGDNWANNMQNVWGGIRLVRTGSQTENFVVQRNTIQRCGSKQGGQTLPNEWEPFLNHPSAHVGGGPYQFTENTISDGLSMALLVTDGFDGRISRNIISGSDWSGIYITDCDASAEIYNNTIVNNGDLVTYPNVMITGESGIWRNNILYSGVSGLLSVENGNLDYNCYYPSPGPGEHSIQADPFFTDPEDGDFSLQSASPCINHGMDVGLPFMGDAPDMGAFEFNPSSGALCSILIPKKMTLFQNYPNPFNPITEISYSLDKPADVKLIVLDIMGREIMTLVNGIQSSGEHKVIFNGSDLPSGVYFYKLEAARQVLIKKMMLVK